MTLPVIPLARRPWAAAIAYLLFCIGYLFSGRMSPMEVTTLVPTAWDQAIPFIGNTVWVYNSQFFLLSFALFTCQTDESFSRLLYAMLAASLVAFAIFYFFPTFIIREARELSSLNSASFRMLYEIDAPTNNLPSLHTALALLSALGGLAHRRRLVRAVGILWALAIVVSTQTTKQHYLVDAAGGLGLGLAAYAWSVSVVRLRFKSRKARVPWSPESA